MINGDSFVGNIAAPFCSTIPNPENEPIPNVSNPKTKEKN
jgi:hypothetical protein